MTSVKRIALVILALSSGPIGLWATFAPKSFYDNFPGGGRHWVAIDGPYNHHLVVDFGSGQLALTVLALAALYWMTRPLIISTAAAYLVASIPHELYHATHLPDMGTTDKVVQLSGLALAIVVALYLLVTNATGQGRAN